MAPRLEAMMEQVEQVAAARSPEAPRLDFLWLELTNRCNLRCVHCYTESGPHTGGRDLLTVGDYVASMEEAFALGCRSVQFIGGEPQLNARFLDLVRAGTRIGFPEIEVYSNLTLLAEDSLRFAAANGIRFATSVYSDKAAVHDAVTGVRGSLAKTLSNLQRLIDAGVRTRAATIRIDQDAVAIERTEQFLSRLGVPLIHVSGVREFGRGEKILGRKAQMSGLCGHCWNGKLCVAPDGQVFPCVMAREWPVGNILETPLADIVHGLPLRHRRREIYEQAWLPKSGMRCPQSCGPDYSSCSPMSCSPQDCPQSCSPPVFDDCVPQLPR